MAAAERARTVGLGRLVALLVGACLLVLPTAHAIGMWFGRAELHAGRIALPVVLSGLLVSGLVLQRAAAQGLSEAARLALRLWVWTPPLACVAVGVVLDPSAVLSLATLHAGVAVWAAFLLFHPVAVLARDQLVPSPTAIAPTLHARHIEWLAPLVGASALLLTSMLVASISVRGRPWALAAVGCVLALAMVANMHIAGALSSRLRRLTQRLHQSQGPGRTLSVPISRLRQDDIGELTQALEHARGSLTREQRVYEQALDKTRAADAQKAEFLSAVSHELRTPLNAISGFAQLLLEGEACAPLSDAQKEDVRLILAGGRQLLELINDILDISMIESGELRLNFAAADIANVVREVVRSHQPLVRGRNVELRGRVENDIPLAICDARRLRQILTNLISNAIKFTEQGSITLTCQFDPDAQTVAMACVDTGIGIGTRDLDAIFEEFAQAGSLKKRAHGTGLGLAIARRIAEYHGGSLAAESEPGIGSTFTLTLPLNPPTRPESIDIASEAARSMAASRTLAPEDGAQT